MLRFLRGPVLGVLAMILWFANTLVWICFFFVVALLKLLIPSNFFRIGCTGVLDDIASAWMSVNNFMLNLLINVKWQIIGDVSLKIDEWYLVLANHQSWVDIVALGQVLNRKIPFLKFFLKKQLIFVPILGFTWWALDYPFMQRYTKSKLQKKPKLAGKDLQATKKAMEKFKHLPISIMNFVEGTRFSEEKRAQQNSIYQYLLTPKAGGIAYTLQMMGQQLSAIIDVTIIYPSEEKSLWQLLSGKIQQVTVHLRKIPITPELIGDYQNDREFRVSFQQWLNKLWQEKDLIIAQEKARNG